MSKKYDNLIRPHFRVVLNKVRWRLCFHHTGNGLMSEINCTNVQFVDQFNGVSHSYKTANRMFALTPIRCLRLTYNFLYLYCCAMADGSYSARKTVLR